MNIAWYIPFQIPLLTPHFTLSFSSFRITLWPMWLANSKRQPCFYPPQSHGQEDTQNWKKKKNTNKPDGKTVLCQRTFSLVFRAVFFTQFNLKRMGPLILICMYAQLQLRFNNITISRSFNTVLTELLFWRTNHEEWDRRGMWHAWGRGEARTEVWCGH
jgi:hypothetical protein